ncbi:gastrula zinc finger protein xFG20-1-like protein [Lates japonicus]|uniref:Gastrula zinc finger protein xFG20-1-like protein n=1 Tax=Lates japonicus TaxID=270547 RepID=A0AAD3NC11_LATJO|nr:gastrula zinc finger protein xFG20-1-like protein [Lates japonicus]
MSRLQSLKVFVSQRLSAAVDEIFGHFEKTISEYEEELNRRHRRMLDVVLTPEIKQRDVREQSARKEEVPLSSRSGSPSLTRRTQSPHIKEEGGKCGEQLRETAS